MKKDNRGFLLAESLVVSTFVLTVLILLYIQFSNLTTNYKNSYNYNNVESIYDLSSVANYLQNNGYDLSTKISASKPYVFVFKDGSCNMDAGIVDSFCDNLVSKMGAKTIIYTSSDISVIKNYISKNADSNLNQKLRDFISRVETNTILNKGRLFAEFDNGTFATIAIDNTVGLSGGDSSGPSLSSCGNSYFGNASNPIVTSGDGLYVDTYESGKCVYKGANPKNYITFNNELWRIISISSDGTIKIMKNASIGSKNFDSQGLRDSTSSGAGGTYCANNSSGCNAWNVNNNFTTTNYSGTVLKDAEINTYLNGTYYNSLSNNSKIANHSFSVGGIHYSEGSLTELISNENNATWNGKIGLITISEYIRASSNSAKCNNVSLQNTNNATCKTTNWMYNIISTEGKLLTLTPYANSSTSINHIRISDASYGGMIQADSASKSYDVTPVFYLSSSVTLTGSGTATDPFKIS